MPKEDEWISVKRDDADLCRICSISNVRKRIWTAESRKDIYRIWIW